MQSVDPLAFDGPDGEAAQEVALEGAEDDEHRHHCQHRARGPQAVVGEYWKRSVINPTCTVSFSLLLNTSNGQKKLFQ